jgi:hypothetical protein
MRKEAYFRIILMESKVILDEIAFIGSEIIRELESGNPNNIHLKANEVGYYLEVVQKYLRYFENTIADSKFDNLDTKIDLTRRKLRSFFRQFESIFFGTDRWYQRVTQLRNRLVEETRNLEDILKSDRSHPS